ncbi:MAG: ABC transporter ATP-binding protein [Firmicutes bacterium]|nr:ABC transporter ATP-binding protein [Bacillota bacterium]
MNAFLDVKNISARYAGERILEDINFTLNRGEFVAVLGSSGCGKSTLQNILAGILPAEEGQVFVEGTEVRGLNPRFSYMPQDDLLMPWRTVLDNVCLYSAIHGGRPAMREQARQRLRDFGLAGCERAYPGELSGGMRQRAAFLRTSLCPADILLLDEPFAALDVITRWDMQDWLKNMRQTLSRTAVLVTHDVDEALYLCDRILILSGRPARIRREIPIEDTVRDRDWLLGQGERKREIIGLLRGNG